MATFDEIIRKSRENQSESSNSGGATFDEIIQKSRSRNGTGTAPVSSATPATPFMPLNVGEFYEKEVVPTVTALERIAREAEKAKAYSDTSDKLRGYTTLPEAPIGMPKIPNPADKLVAQAQEVANQREKEIRKALGGRNEFGSYVAGATDVDYTALAKKTNISEDELRNYAAENRKGAYRQAYEMLSRTDRADINSFIYDSKRFNLTEDEARGIFATYQNSDLKKMLTSSDGSNQDEIVKYIDGQIRDTGVGDRYGYGPKAIYRWTPDYALAVLKNTSAPAEGYTKENIMRYKARAIALTCIDPSSNKKWEKEAEDMYDVLFNNFFSADEDLLKAGDGWGRIAADIRTVTHPTAEAIMLGLSKGIGAESVATLINSDVKEQSDRAFAKAAALSPTAAEISSTAGSVALYTALAYVSGGAAGSIGGAAGSLLNIPAASSGLRLATSALSGAMALGGMSAVQNLGGYVTGDISLGEYGKRIGEAEVTGAASALASGLVSLRFDKALTGKLKSEIGTKAGVNYTTAVPDNAYDVLYGGNRMPLVASVKNPQTPFYIFTRNMASGLAGTGAYIAANAAVADEKQSEEEMARQLIFGFVTSLLHSFISAHSFSAGQREYARSIEGKIAEINKSIDSFKGAAANTEARGYDLSEAASKLVLEIERLRRGLVENFIASDPNTLNDLAVTDYYLVALQETLGEYVKIGTYGASEAYMTGLPEASAVAPITDLVAYSMESGINDGAIGATEAAEINSEYIPGAAAAASESVSALTTTEQHPAQNAAAQIAIDLSPAQAQAEGVLPSAEINAGNAQITPPARNEQEAAARTESAKSWEIIGRDFGENGQKAFADVFDPELTKGELGTLAETFTAFYNAGKNNTGLDSISRELMQAALEVYGNDTDAAFEMERAAVLAGRADAEMKSSLVEDRAADDGVIDLSDDTELAKRIAGKSGSEKYNAIRDYILEELSGIDVVLSDGNNAIVDRKDAQHIAHKAGDKKRRAISEIKRLVEHAKLVATEKSVYNNKFRDFRYYEASVRYHDKTFPVYINVGIAKNDGSYHIYDITHKLRATAHRLNGVGRVTQTYALEAVPLTPDSIPDNTEKVNTVSEKSDNPAKKSDNPANTSMTMAEARRMIETAYRVGEIKEWYADEGTNQTVDEWLKNVGSDDIAMIIENDFDLQRKYINSNTAILDDEYQIEDVIDAYKAGTLVGKEKKKAQRLDVKKETGLKDDRFYAPREIENAKERFELAQQRITNANKQQVIQARADIVIFAHNRNAAELLGISQAELNKKLRSWTRYSASAREISERINAGVPLENRWTGIENSSFVNQASISQKDIDMLVKSVTGDPNGAERKYIARVMLALDTHIDYKGLNFIFESKAELNKKHGFSGRTNGVYNGYDTIACKYMAPNTVAHEMGHYLDTRFARDLVGGREDSRHYLTRGVNKDIVRERYGEDGVRFVDNFNVFMDGLTDVNDAYSSYSNDRAEVFARFVARFVEWTENVAAGYRMSNYEYNSYDDRFTTAQYVEFARLLQEKSLLDGMRANGAVTTAEGANTSEIKQSISKIVDVDGKDYGIGVYLDSILLEGLTDAERSDMVKEYVKTELAGSHLLAYNSNGAPVDVAIAEYGERFTDENGKKKKVLKELYGKNNKFKAKQESVVLADELLLTAKQGEPEKSRKAHDWLDNNGQNDWDYWTTYIQDKNKTVWLATLNIANATDGRKILYDINPIKMVAEGLSWPSTTTNKYTTTPSAKSQEEIKKYFHDDEPAAVADAYADLWKQLAEANRKLANEMGDLNFSNRELLANALETVTKDSAEAQFIERYRDEIKTLNETEAELKEVRAELRKKIFSGTRDDARIEELTAQRKHLENKLNYWDKKLMTAIEASKPLQRVVERERARAYKRAREQERAKVDALREGRELREAQDRLLKMLRRINNKKLSTPNKAWLEQHFGDIYTLSKTLTGKKLAAAEDIKNRIAALTDENSPDYDPNYAPSPRLLARLQEITGKKTDIASMELDEVYDRTALLMEFAQTIENSKKLAGVMEKREIHDLAYHTITDIATTKGNESDPAEGFKRMLRPFVRAGEAAADFVNTEVLSPIASIQRYTGFNDNDPLYQRAEELAKAEGVYDKYTTDANALFDELLNDKQFVKFFRGDAGKPIVFKARGVGGDGMPGGEIEVQITPALRTWLYLNSLNADNLNHIKTGGAIFPDLNLLRKGKYADAFSEKNSKRVLLSPEEIKRITAGMTAKELQFARAWAKYESEMAQPGIAQVHEEQYGTPPKMVDEGYFMIRTKMPSSSAIDGLEQMQIDGTTDIGSPGWLKERKDSKLPIYAYPADMMIKRAIDDHARFVAYSIPVSNFNKIWNANMWGKDSIYNPVTRTDETMFRLGTSVKDTLKAKWGQNSVDVVQQMLDEYVGKPRGKNSKAERALNKIRGNYAQARLAAGLGTALKQMPSGIAAAPVIDFRSLAKAANPGYSIDTSFIDDYTASYAIRKKGYSSTELGDLAKQGKKLPKWLIWYQTADLVTTGPLLKRAAAFYVRRNFKTLEVGSEAYKQKVAEVYDKIINETQPTYDVMYRANALRNPSPIWRALNMFKTQPYKNYTILYTALGNLRAKGNALNDAEQFRYTDEQGKAEYEQARSEYTEAKKRVVRAFVSQILSGLAISAIMVLNDFLVTGNKKKYQDEDGDVTLLSFLKGLGLNFASTGAGMFPLGGAILETVENTANIISGNKLFDTYSYGLKVPEVETLNNVQSTIDKLVEALAAVADAEDASDWEKIGRALWKTAVDTGEIFGIPSGNLNKTLKAALRQVFRTQGKYVGEYLTLRVMGTVEANKKAHYDNLYNAYEHNQAQYKEVYDLLIKNGITPEAIRNAMNERIKNAQGAQSVNELSSSDRYLNPDQQDAYNKMLSQVESTDVYKRYEAQVGDDLGAYSRLIDLAYDVTDGKKRNTWQDYAIVKEYGLTKTEYVLYQLALDIVDEPNKDGKYGTYTDKEKAAAVKIAKGN